MPSQIRAIINECSRQIESCCYTSTALFEVVRIETCRRNWLVGLPVFFGGIATIGILVKSTEPWVPYLLAAFAFLGSVMPAINTALRISDTLDDYRSAAAKFKNLQDAFRQAAEITSLAGLEKLQQKFDRLMERMNEARDQCVIVPEWAFAYAKKKIEDGHYQFAVDAPTGLDENKP